MLKSLSLKNQLYILCSIFFVPILILAGMHARQSLGDIEFSSKEREGVAYLYQLFPTVARPANNSDEKSVAQLTSISSKYDTEMRTWEPSTEFRISLTAKRAENEQVDTGVKLITAIGDGSNLILDPDLDSFYVMDVVINRLPQLTSQLWNVDNILSTSIFDTQHRDSLSVFRGELVASRKGLDSSTFSALRNNSSGTVSGGISQQYSQLITALDAQIGRIDKLLALPQDSVIDPSLIADIHSNHGKIIRRLTATYGAYLKVLDSLISARITGKKSSLASSLLFSVFAVLLAFYLALFITKRIQNNVSSLSERIRGLTKGDYTSPIPLQDQQDELGRIARSLNIFKEHADEKAEMTQTIENERAEATRKMEKLAYHDDLTDLPNRKLLNIKISDHMQDQSGTNTALIYLDLDGFKEVNDTMTHVAGDAVLCEVARRLSNFATGGELVSRLGGDEFALFLPKAPDHDSLLEFCRKMLIQLAEPYRVQDSLQFLSASAGIAIMPIMARHDSFELVRRADVAMYRAKALGKNQAVIFDPTFDAEALRRVELETALREAVNNEDIRLFFQPQFDVATSRLVSVEGLARWNHARLGDIPPSVFIPLAESCGLIHQLGRQMLRQTSVAVLRWPDLRISVNLSVAQLRHHQFMNDITMLVAELGSAVGRIELEITESILMDDNPLIATKLSALRDMGFELAIDDFGTGYSSLGYLARFKFDRLKIDRAFILAAQKDARGAALLGSIASMGRALGMDVCAEGVETYEGVESATKAGCNLLQGFYFSPAVEMGDIDHMLANGAGGNSELSSNADKDLVESQADYKMIA